MPVDENGPKSRDFRLEGTPPPVAAEKWQNEGASEVDAPSLSELEEALRAGWRVEVDLVNRRWRFVRGSKRKRRWTPYYALDSVPGGAERIRKAQEESERQRQARIAAWSKR